MAVRDNRKSVARIGGAFLLLAAVSAYRQISLHFIPRDPALPAVVLFVYLILLAWWRESVRSRIQQKSMRAFLLTENFLMLFWGIVRFIQETVLADNVALLRASGYLIAVPAVLLPLFGLYASFCLGRAGDWRPRRRWYFLFAPAAVLIALMLTNESHHLVFRLLEGETGANLYFHPAAGLYVIFGWAAVLEFVRITLLVRKTWGMPVPPHKKALPFLIAVSMVGVSAVYAASSFWVNLELIEYSALVFFLEALLWEACILIGMVPVNTEYEDVFDRSTVAMQIVDAGGRTFRRSYRAPELGEELFQRLLSENRVLTPEGAELRMCPVHGGYAVWRQDISALLRAADELARTTGELEQEGGLLRRELQVRSEEASVREQNRLYDRLAKETGTQLERIRTLLQSRDQEPDKAAVFRKICLVGTYIKRRSNLRLVEQSEGMLSAEDLRLCWRDLSVCLARTGTETHIEWSGVPPSADLAMAELDVFEFLLEREDFSPRVFRAEFGNGAVFSVEPRKSVRDPGAELARMAGPQSRVRCEAGKTEYRVFVEEV